MIVFFFFNDTATTEIYTLSLHDALPIFASWSAIRVAAVPASGPSAAITGSASSSSRASVLAGLTKDSRRSEEHTSELQSRQYLVCRLLLEKKKKIKHLTTSLADKYTLTL